MIIKIQNINFEINDLMFDDDLWENNGKENIKIVIEKYLKEAIEKAYFKGYEEGL